MVLTSSVISLNVFMCVCEDENTSKHPRHDRVKEMKSSSDTVIDNFIAGYQVKSSRIELSQGSVSERICKIS